MQRQIELLEIKEKGRDRVVALKPAGAIHRLPAEVRQKAFRQKAKAIKIGAFTIAIYYFTVSGQTPAVMAATLEQLLCTNP